MIHRITHLAYLNPRICFFEKIFGAGMFGVRFYGIPNETDLVHAIASRRAIHRPTPENPAPVMKAHFFFFFFTTYFTSFSKIMAYEHKGTAASTQDAFASIPS